MCSWRLRKLAPQRRCVCVFAFAFRAEWTAPRVCVFVLVFHVSSASVMNRAMEICSACSTYIFSLQHIESHRTYSVEVFAVVVSLLNLCFMMCSLHAPHGILASLSFKLYARESVLLIDSARHLSCATWLAECAGAPMWFERARVKLTAPRACVLGPVFSCV